MSIMLITGIVGKLAVYTLIILFMYAMFIKQDGTHNMIGVIMGALGLAVGYITEGNYLMIMSLILSMFFMVEYRFHNLEKLIAKWNQQIS